MTETATYKNPWYKGPKNPEFGPEYFKTDGTPVEYRGYKIYNRVRGHIWDVVKNDVCLDQLSGASGARQAIDKLVAKEEAQLQAVPSLSM